MNILELCLSSGLGGLELYVYRASDALCANNSITAVLLEHGQLDNYYKKNSSIPRLHLARSKNPLPIINAIKLANIIDQREIYLIHMHWGKDFALAALAKKLSRRKPKLVYTRQMMITRYKSDFYHRFLYSQLDLLITITKQLESLYEKFTPLENDKIKTLYYGVTKPGKILDHNEVNTLRQSKGFTDDDFIVGLFGRLEDGKGQHLLIKAIAQAKKDNKIIKALIVGHEMTSGYQDILKQLSESLDVSDNIAFNGFVDNPQELMQICDCLCLTTYEETFGLVLPEAMRSDVAVIGSNKGGVPEIIDHQKTGLLFESKNADSLYQQISYLYDNPEMKVMLAHQGKEKADVMFDNDTHYQALETILSGVLDR